MREWHPHSAEKISIFEDYIAAFARAAQGAPNRVYVDAFAGDTVNVLRTTGDTFAGSAEIAIGVKPEFTHAALFEKSAKRARQLRELRDAHPSLKITVYEGDCNALIPDALNALPRKAPTFAFLDPDGMELDWRTVELLANHKRGVSGTKVEMWILVSTSGIVRLLGDTKDPAAKVRNTERVARLYGARGPWERVRAARQANELQPDEARRAYLFLYMDRLAQLGYKHLLARPIHNTRGELYVMVFATDHPAGSTIMRWAQEKPRVIKRAPALFDVPDERPAYEDLYTGWRDELALDLPDWEELEA